MDTLPIHRVFSLPDSVCTAHAVLSKAARVCGGFLLLAFSLGLALAADQPAGHGDGRLPLSQERSLSRGGVVSVMPLDKLLDLSAPTAALVEEAKLELVARAARAEQLAHATGWQLFGSLRYADVTELLTESRDSQYSTRVFTVGLRHPLLGSDWKEKQAIANARHDVAIHSETLRVLMISTRREIRIAYADWWRSQQEHRWCVEARRLSTETGQTISQRLDAGLLTRAEAERQRLAVTGPLMQCDRVEQNRIARQQRLQALTPVAVDHQHLAVADELPEASDVFLGESSSLDRHPLLVAARLKLEHARAARNLPWHDGVESHFQVAANTESRPGFGRPGREWSLGVSFAMPLGLSAYQDARRREAQALAESVFAAYQAQSVALHQAFERLRVSYEQSLQRLRSVQAQWHGVESGMAEAFMRRDAGLEDRQDIIVEKIKLGFALIELWHAAWLHQVELMQFSDALDVEFPWTGPGSLGHESDSRGLARPRHAWQTIGSTSLPPVDVPAPGGSEWTRGTYIWDSQSLLDPASRADALAELREAGMTRLYLGLTAEQVADVGKVQPLLASLISAADSQNMEVSLLLGEPTWIEPEGRAALVELIHLFKALPFRTLHLDLEVEQLGWPVPPERVSNWLETLRVAAQESPWPIEISSHHRWFRADTVGHVCVPCVLPEIGVSRVSLMIYTRNAERSVALTEEIARRWPHLRFRLAQSVERILPADESWFGETADRLDSQGRRFRVRLAPSGVDGLDWQDWTDYPRGGGY